MTPRLVPVIGFPEFHQSVFRHFPDFFAALPALQKVFGDLINEGHDHIAAHEHLIINLGSLVGISLMEVVLLGTNGYGPAAVKAARSLLEAAVTAEYLRLHPDEYARFHEYIHIERHQEAEFLREYLPESYESLPVDTREDIQSQYERVQGMFPNLNAWCRHDLAMRSQLTGYLESYKTLHKLASSFIHVTHYGMQRRFEGEDEFRISGPPSLEWLRLAFSASHVLTIGTISTIMRIFHPEQLFIVAALEDRCRAIWTPPDPGDRRVRR